MQTGEKSSFKFKNPANCAVCSRAGCIWATLHISKGTRVVDKAPKWLGPGRVEPIPTRARMVKVHIRIRTG